MKQNQITLFTKGYEKMIKYDPKSLKAEEFINDEEIRETLKYADRKSVV